MLVSVIREIPGKYRFFTSLTGKRGMRIVVPVLLLSITFAIFYPSLTHDFQYEWDDQWMVLRHPMLMDQSPSNIWYYFTHYDRGQYFPLNQLYYIGIYRLFGFDPGAYHAGSLLLHFTNVVLVFALVYRLMKWVGKEYSERKAVLSAGFIALIFAVHPLQVESVAWISASKVLLYALFTLLGLFFYLYYKQKNRFGFLILIILCYIAGMMSKEQAIIFPLNLLLLDGVLHKSGKVHFTKKVMIEKLPFFVLAFLFWYWSSQNHLGVLNVEDSFPAGQRLVLGSYSLLIYIFRFLAPGRLLYFYGYPISQGEVLSPLYYIYVLLVLFFLLYLADLYRRKEYFPVFGLLFFGVNLLLVLHILPMPRAMITADRYMYLSIIGLSAWAGWGLRYLHGRAGRKGRRILLFCSGVLLLVLMTYSNILTRKWENSDTIKQEVRQYLEPLSEPENAEE